MIKTFPFEDAHAMSILHPETFQLPSKTQIKKLTVGDFVQINAAGERFWCKVLFVRDTDIVGQIDNELISTDKHGLKADDIIAFTTFNIYKVLPDDKRMKLQPFVLLTHPQTQDQLFVLHTQPPRMIAAIIFGEEVKAKDAVWFDEPLDYETEAPELLRKMGNWFFYNYVKK